MSVARAAARQVATITAPKSIPAIWSTAGWTKMMYAMATNVVTPPMTSVLTSVLFPESLKSFSSMEYSRVSCD